MRVLNLTQHTASPDQIAVGVIDLDAETRATVSALLTFDECPDAADIADRAHDLAVIAARARTDGDTGAVLCDRVMIGGAPWLMGALAEALRAQGLTPLFAFSRRESVDVAQPDGSVRKTAVFRHAGWVPA
jgi:hypothetical protein